MEIKSLRCIVLLIIVVGLAGCSGQSPSETSVSYPTGYNESGVTDPELAADQHTTALSERDNYTEAVNLTSPMFEGFVETMIRIDTVENRSIAEMEINRSGQTFRETKMYHNGTKRYTNTQIDMYGDSYTTGNESLSSFQDDLVKTSEIDRWLTNISFEAVGTVIRDKETLYRYSSTGVADPEAFFYTAEFSTIDAVKSVNSTLLVDEEGIIREFDVTVTYRSDGKTQTGTINYRITGIDATTVKKPGWIEKAKTTAGPNGSNPPEEER